MSSRNVEIKPLYSPHEARAALNRVNREQRRSPGEAREALGEAAQVEIESKRRKQCMIF
jgi:hypothetical protein